MKLVNGFSIKFLGTAIALSAITFSCKNNDTNDDATTTDTTSTTTVMHADTATAPAAMDTANRTTNATEDKMSAGLAKPNPAKKGMKGKVTISESAPPTNASGKMEADNTGTYSNVEVIPSFPGGNKGLQKFFDDNLEYPVDASAEGVEGTVNVSFVVDENGKLTSPTVMGDKMGYGLEAEALRVVNKMPTWNPGKLKGKNVKTKFTLPVKFVLY